MIPMTPRNMVSGGRRGVLNVDLASVGLCVCVRARVSVSVCYLNSFEEVG